MYHSSEKKTHDYLHCSMYHISFSPPTRLNNSNENRRSSEKKHIHDILYGIGLKETVLKNGYFSEEWITSSDMMVIVLSQSQRCKNIHTIRYTKQTAPARRCTDSPPRVTQSTRYIFQDSYHILLQGKITIPHLSRRM